MKKQWRNKSCPNCPQNKREDVVWRKGFEDGLEVGTHGSKENIKAIIFQFKHIIGHFYWKI